MSEPTGGVDEALRRRALAPPPRTLVDIFRATVAQCADEPALDNGAEVLTYAEFDEAATDLAAALAASGIGPGDKVGVRIASGTTDLYVAILGILLAGAAYVPVDADDPQERARTVFAEAAVAAVVGDGLTISVRRSGPGQEVAGPEVGDDAWVIFTSGSTGKPKGVAVTHRSAAAFVDAESRMFLQQNPIGPGDRVMAGLSVAFDASCEEMWLAWRYGACLVPAPRSLVRSGMDLAPWLTANRITIVSTVPTLVALWPIDALAKVRLVILGGEALPPELNARLVAPGREVWNTYGPTEATVVACGAMMTGAAPVRIGLPLDGWDLAVVDASGQEVPVGESGELIIGGVGLARYLDPVKDAQVYAAMPTLGWERAYRSGDLVVNDPEGLRFLGRADDQVKVGGRRIELGEIDSALLALPGVSAAAAAVRASASGSKILVGYLTVDEDFDARAATAHLRTTMPAALVPRLAPVASLPTRTSGKIDRDALPWPLPTLGRAEGAPGLTLDGTQQRIRDLWAEIIGASPERLEDDFFDLGGGSLMAAQMVARLRETHPEITIADIYDHPTLAGLAAHLDEMAIPTSRLNTNVRPVERKTQAGQLLAHLPLTTIRGLRWLTWLAIVNNLFAPGGSLAPLVGGVRAPDGSGGPAAGTPADGLSWLHPVSWWWPLLGVLLLITPIGRMLLAAAGARVILAGITPGDYPRGGRINMRVWLAERWVDEVGATSTAGAVLLRWYARLLGADIGRDVDLHALPPVTGMLRIGDGASIEPEVDLTGHWLDGDRLKIGPVRIGAGARIGARSTLCPGADIGDGADVVSGSAVFGHVPAGERWSGSPARATGQPAAAWWSAKAPVDATGRSLNKPRWVLAYAASSLVIAGLPMLAIVAGALTAWPAIRHTDSLSQAVATTALWLPVGTLAGFVTLALAILLIVRLLGWGLAPGTHPVQSRRAWQAWSTIRILDEARTWLFPLYSSALTPLWLRALGARIGPDVEASTVLLIPALTTVGEGAFLADDTLIGGYELGGGWLRVDEVKIGKHAFVGNSGMAAPGRKVPKAGLVAVLSAAPRKRKAKAGTSWIGSPPEQLRRAPGEVDQQRTYHPPRRLRVARALVEVCRVVPQTIAIGLALATLLTLQAIAARGWLIAAALSGVVLMLAGALAAAITTAAKWLLVGKVRAGDHPLWSGFVWRNELADTFVEVLAAPWFARATTGTPVLNLWLRSLGAKVGAGVWCETYWLPEPDLIDLRDGASVGQGCVVQTHLFHDRVLSLDSVTLRAGSTLGPNSVVLPAATLGRHATIGPASLVMRGESVPDKSRWIGNPISPWSEEHDHIGELAAALDGVSSRDSGRG